MKSGGEAHVSPGGAGLYLCGPVLSAVAAWAIKSNRPDSVSGNRSTG